MDGGSSRKPDGVHTECLKLREAPLSMDER